MESMKRSPGTIVQIKSTTLKRAMEMVLESFKEWEIEPFCSMTLKREPDGWLLTVMLSGIRHDSPE